MKTPVQRIPELDGLRGIAILSVILFHLSLCVRLPEIFAMPARFGWSGVDLFFVLSGFLIGSILIGHRESDAYFVPFYARRFFRIVPLYLAILAVYGLVWFSSAQNRLIEYFHPPMPAWTYLSFTNNFWIARHGNMGVFLAPSWSLAIEEQFYLALPLIVRFVKPRWLLTVLTSMMGVIVALRVTFTYHAHAPQYQLYTLPWFREDALLLGVICAILMQREKVRDFLRKNWWMLAVLAVAAFASVLACSPTLYAPDESPDASRALLAFGLSATAVLYAALLLLVLLFPTLCVPLRLRPLSEVGKVSYCLYLIHTIVIEGGRRALLQYGDRWTILQARFLICVVMFLMFMVAQLSWWLFESQMLRIGHLFVFERRPSKEAAGLIKTASA